MATSVNRLTNGNPNVVAYDEAPTPEHHHEALDLGKDPDPGDGYQTDLDSRPQLKGRFTDQRVARATPTSGISLEDAARLQIVDVAAGGGLRGLRQLGVFG